jgi:hypothetical protein
MATALSAKRHQHAALRQRFNSVNFPVECEPEIVTAG